MSLKDLQARYSNESENSRHFLVTEVTRMTAPEVCVAAIDLKRLKVVRPLRWNHHNWPKDLVNSGLRPGRIIRGKIRPVQDHHGFPHETEDMQLTEDFAMLEQISESVLFSDLAPVVDRSIDDLFAGNVQEGKYVLDGTHCRSLGSILAPAATAYITIDAFGKTRFSFEDPLHKEYVLPVTDRRVADDQASGLADTREPHRTNSRR